MVHGAKMHILPMHFTIISQGILYGVIYVYWKYLSLGLDVRMISCLGSFIRKKHAEKSWIMTCNLPVILCDSKYRGYNPNNASFLNLSWIRMYSLLIQSETS